MRAHIAIGYKQGWTNAVTSTAYKPLLDLLDTGAMLLMPSSASARALRRSFDDRQRQRGLGAWAPPQVLGWTQFTAGLWTSLVVAGSETRLLLNPAQEHTLWCEAVMSVPSAGGPSLAPLSSPTTLADLASSAFNTAAAHCVLPRLRAAATSPDTRTFAAWAEAYQRLLQARDCLASALLEEALALHLRQGSLQPGDTTLPYTLPQTLHLVAFPEPAPAQGLLLTELQAAGVRLEHHALVAPQTAPAVHLLAADPQAELQLVADTLADLFDAADAPSQVTLLLPDPAAGRAELESVLRATLAPELNDIASDLSSQPWEFSSGAPLATHALIADALSLLRLATGPVPLARVTSLLCSPFLGGPAQRDASARFDAWLRGHYRTLRPELDLATLTQQLGVFRARMMTALPAAAAALPTWPANLMAQLQRTPLDAALPRAHSDWAETLRLLLRAAEFPPTADLTATTFALTRSWDSLLDTVATLDFSGLRVPFSTVLEALARAAETTPFMPPTTHAPIQIMSYAEAAATAHEVVLVVHATDANLPRHARPHPLLPWTLQRDLGLPGSDLAADAARARSAFLDLLATSSRVLLTSAAEDADGKLRPSPLIAACDIPSHIAPAHAAQSHIPIPLDQFYDDDPLPAPPTEVRGGASVLTLQAACGFRAFAQLRLHASDLDDPGLGLNPRDSGSLLHRTLHHLWSELGSQAALNATNAAERIQLLGRAIDQALLDRRIPERTPWDAAYTLLVTQRLRNLLLQWLQEEEQRGPFRIDRLETQQEIKVGPLTLTVRIDRIDAVSDTQGDGVVFVDYKTGASAHPKQWRTERPEEPQLPLYTLHSLTDPERVKGLAFARIRSGDMRWHGLHTEDGILPARTPVHEISHLIAEWHDTLTALAVDFYEGDVRVRPANYPVTCEHCGQRLLCRLDPTTLAPINTADESSFNESSFNESGGESSTES